MTRWLILSLVLAAGGWLGWGYFALHPEWLNERIATHWNINMEPDSFVRRQDAWARLILFPAIMSVMAALGFVLPWLSPKNFQVESFRGVFEYVIALTVALMGYLGVLVYWSALPGHELPQRAFIAGFFLFFGLAGNVMGKVQRNFWLGVRTPWTLANETVWTRTHRLAAWLWTVMGVLGFFAVLVGVPWWACFIGLMAAALYPVLFSLILYKKLERQGKI